MDSHLPRTRQARRSRSLRRGLVAGALAVTAGLTGGIATGALGSSGTQDGAATTSSTDTPPWASDLVSPGSGSGTSHATSGGS